MKKRIELYDVAKGILIILVVLGHIITLEYPLSSFLKRFIYSFHVPAFFIISGMLINPSIVNKYSFIQYVKHQFKKIMIPYFLFEILAVISQMAILSTKYVNFKGALINTLLIYCNAGATWYLATLFIVLTFYYIMLKLRLCIGRYPVDFMVFILFMISFILPKSHMCIVLSRCLIALGFVWIGQFLILDIINFITDPKQISNREKFSLVLILTVIQSILTISNGKVGMNLAEYNNPILYITESIIGSVFILLISSFIHFKSISYIGKKSLYIMGTHLNIIVIFEKVMNVDKLPITYWLPVLCLIILFESFFIMFMDYITSYKLLNHRH